MIPIFELLVQVIELYKFVLIVAVIMSWLVAFNVINTNNQVIASIGRALYNLTEPVYRPIRRFLPDFGGVDLSPIVVVIILFFLEQIIRSVLAPALLGL